MCLVFHSPDNPCQDQWLHQSPTSMQGSSSLHSSWWRKHQAETNLLGLSFARSIHPHWNPIGFIYLVFYWPLLDQHQKTSFVSILLVPSGSSASHQQSKSPTLLFGGEVWLGEDMESRPHNSQKHKDDSNTALQWKLWRKHCFAQVGTAVVPTFPPLDQDLFLRAISLYTVGRVRSHALHELQRWKCPFLLQKCTAE